MTRRSIPVWSDLGSDEDLKGVYRQVWSALQEVEPATVDVNLLLDAANIASRIPMEFGAKQAAVFRYVQALVEPQRSILRHRLYGRKARQIAELMDMDTKAVCNELAVIYAEMQALLSRQLQ